MNPFDPGPERSSISRRRRSSHEQARALRCDAAAPDVVAYFDGEANDEAALRARRHLDSCPDCFRMWRDWGDARLLLRTSRLPEAPAHWPASLIQRARLQALMPTLFTSAADPDPEHPDPLQPPRELQDAILSLTTRAHRTTAAADISSRLGQELRTQNQERDLGDARVRLYRLATRACASALAAWMLVLASVPSPQPAVSVRPAAPNSPPPASRPVGRKSPSRSVDAARRSQAPFAPPILQRASVAAASVSRPASGVGARPGADKPEAVPAPAVAERAERRAAASPDGLSEPASAASDEAAEAAPRARSRERVPERLSARSGPVQAPGAAREDVAPVDSTKPQPRSSLPSPVSQSHDVGVAEPPQGASARASSAPPLVAAPTPHIRLALGVRSGKVANNPAPRREQDGQGLRGSREAEVWEGEDHEALTRALNDARPSEVGEAIDSYAAALVDEGEGSL